MFGCHSALMHSTEVWRRALDEGKYVAIVMSDLSKAFDCLPHNLLLEKCSKYKFSNSSVNLLRSYLTDRYQRVKICQSVSSWSEMIKGVPQGSIVGPHCFNLYINDLLLVLKENCIIPCNYADDNTCTVIGRTKDEAVKLAEKAVNILANWFKDNMMKANIDKFQFMLLCPKVNENKETYRLNIDNISLDSLTEAKLLGVYIDRELTFNSHVKNKCKKANSKLKVLQRLSKYLTSECKLAIVRSFIVSHFTYCAPLLHFCAKYFKDRMEKILYRGLRYVFSDYQSSYEDLLKKSDLCRIEVLREKAIIIEMYKVLHSLGPEYMKEIFNIGVVNSRRGPIFHIPRIKTTRFGLHSLRLQGPRLWNDLTLNVKTSKNLENLKLNLQSYTGQSCKCSLCRK